MAHSAIHMQANATGNFPQSRAQVDPDTRFVTNYQPGLVLSKCSSLIIASLTIFHFRLTSNGAWEQCAQ